MKYLSILFIISSVSLQAQQWVSSYENGLDDFSYGIVTDDQGNSYIAGQSIDSNSLSSSLIVKYDPLGVQQWAIVYSYGFPVLNSYASSIQYDNSGNVYVGGNFQKLDSSYAIITLKYSTSGNLIWNKIFDIIGENNYFYDLILDASHNIYVLSEYIDTATLLAHGTRVIRYNTQGDTVWTSNFEDVSAFNLTADEFGNVFVCGLVFDNVNLFDCQIYKINANGSQGWSETYGSPSMDFPNSIRVNPTGDVYVSVTNGLLEDAVLLKYDPDGLLVWERNYNSNENLPDAARLLELDNSGNLIMVGTTEVDEDINRTFILKFDPSGNRQWTNVFSDSNLSVSSADLHVTADGNSFLAGTIGDFTNSDVFTKIYNSAGNQEWESVYSSSGNSVSCSRIVLDNNKNIFITGVSQVIGGNFKTLTLMYSNQVNITNISQEIPESFSLKQNFPNPFNPTTKIIFNIHKSENVRLAIYDILGKEVKVIIDGLLPAGSYEASFNGAGHNSGIYFYKLTAGNFSETKKMNLIK